MLTLKRQTLAILLVMLLSIAVQAEDLCEISMEPLQDIFLYGTEPAIHTVFKNISDDTISVQGVWDGDHYAVIDLAIDDDIDLTKYDVSLHGARILLAPGESYSKVASLSWYRIQENRSHHETDPAMKWAYPLGHFMVKAIVKCQKSGVPQYYYPSCTYRVEMPTSEEDKAVLDSMRLAMEYMQMGDQVIENEIYQKLFTEHPDSPYRHNLYLFVQSGIAHLNNYNSVNSLNEQFKWTTRYLSETEMYFPYALDRALGIIEMHFKTAKAKKDCIDYLETLKRNEKFSIYKNYLDGRISSVQRQRTEVFNRVNY